MLAHLALAILTSQTAARLSHWREQFESVLKVPELDIGYTTVRSETLGGGHGTALYPIGSASERYLISFNEAVGGYVNFEKRHKGIATVDWHVPFRPAKKNHEVHGTIRKYLMSFGFEISSRTKLTPTIRRQLSATGYFAGYTYHSIMGGFACVVKPDGAATDDVKSPDKFPVTPDEEDLLILQHSNKNARPPSARHPHVANGHPPHPLA